MPSSTPAGGDWENTSTAAASSWPCSTSAGPVASNPRVHQASTRVRNSVSSTAHPGPWPGPGTYALVSPSARENRLIRRSLLTLPQPAGSPRAGRGESVGKDHFCQDSRRPQARPATSRRPGLPRYAFTSSARPARTFTDSPGKCGSRR